MMRKIAAMMMGVLLAGVANANLLVNGSFETGPVGAFTTPTFDLEGWRIFDTTVPDAVTYELVNDATEATDGNNYVKITSTTTDVGPDSGLDTAWAGLGAVAVSAGASYRVTFDAKWLAGTDNRLSFSIKTMEGNANLEVLVSEGFALTSEWKTYTYEVTPTLLESGGAEPNFYVGFRAKGATLLDETICIDNVSVTEIPDNTTLVNGSFEEGPVGVLSLPSYAVTGWRAFDTSGSNSVELVNDPIEATDGTNYIQITSVATGNFGDTGLDVRPADAGECMVYTGNTYRVSFDAKWVSGTGNQLIFYVKTVTEGTSTTLEASLVNESFALNADWTSYSYEFTPTVQPTNVAKRIAFYAVFRPKIGGTLQAEVIRLDNVRLLNLTTGSYVGWMGSYPAAGVATNYTDDPDGDGMNNLLEYALGGEPDVSDASSVQPAVSMENGWMVYVYKQRKNHESFGLDYSVLSGADLVSGPLTNATTVIGSGEYDSDFNLVTNGIPTDAPQAFMQLKVQKND